MAITIGFGTSRALAAFSLRGAPPKLIPYTFTKQSAANAPVNANIIMAIGPASFNTKSSLWLKVNKD